MSVMANHIKETLKMVRKNEDLVTLLMVIILLWQDGCDG
jgi:hypothetical protein